MKLSDDEFCTYETRFNTQLKCKFQQVKKCAASVNVGLGLRSSQADNLDEDDKAFQVQTTSIKRLS